MATFSAGHYTNCPQWNLAESPKELAFMVLPCCSGNMCSIVWALTLNSYITFSS